jgi:hypothetical protein
VHTGHRDPVSSLARDYAADYAADYVGLGGVSSSPTDTLCRDPWRDALIERGMFFSLFPTKEFCE